MKEKKCSSYDGGPLKKRLVVCVVVGLSIFSNACSSKKDKAIIEEDVLSDDVKAIRSLEPEDSLTLSSKGRVSIVSEIASFSVEFDRLSNDKSLSLFYDKWRSRLINDKSGIQNWRDLGVFLEYLERREDFPSDLFEQIKSDYSRAMRLENPANWEEIGVRSGGGAHSLIAQFVLSKEGLEGILDLAKGVADREDRWAFTVLANVNYAHLKLDREAVNSYVKRMIELSPSSECNELIVAMKKIWESSNI